MVKMKRKEGGVSGEITTPQCSAQHSLVGVVIRGKEYSFILFFYSLSRIHEASSFEEKKSKYFVF